MKLNFYPVLFILFIAKSFQAEESINAKLIDSTTQNPIPYPTRCFIKTSSGIRNENGNFLVYLNRNFAVTDSLIYKLFGLRS